VLTRCRKDSRDAEKIRRIAAELEETSLQRRENSPPNEAYPADNVDPYELLALIETATGKSIQIDGPLVYLMSISIAATFVSVFVLRV
jgi:hypothetical protein